MFTALGGFVVVAVASAVDPHRSDGKTGDADDALELSTSDDWDPGAPERRPVHVPRVPRRFWVTLAFACLFFAGASFTAFGGDQVAKLMQADAVDGTAVTTTADTATTDTTASTDTTSAAVDTAPPSAATAPAAAPAAAPAPGTNAVKSQDAVPAVSPVSPASSAANGGSSQTSTAAASAAGDATSAAPASAPAATAAHEAAHVQHAVSRVARSAVVVTRLRRQLNVPKPKPDPEVNQPGVQSVVWLDSALPDPTPPAARLTDAFAASLTSASHETGAAWALVLGVLRAEGADGSSPADHATLVRLGERLVALERSGRTAWDAAAAFVGTTSGADRALALANYNRAVGLWALVHGLDAAKAALTQKVLGDSRISIYPGGRSDLQAGRVDVRVAVVMEYLAEAFGQETVSCLISGHGLYARPGVISAHIYGRAVDVAALGGESILGHQQPGSVTEQAVRDLLLLPSGLLPQQVISLISMGGPSFALASHYNHIHVGY